MGNILSPALFLRLKNHGFNRYAYTKIKHTPDSPRQKRMKWKKTIIWAVIVLGCLMSALMFVGAPYAKEFVEAHSKEWTGRKLTIGHLRINLFTGGVSAKNVQFFEEDDKTLFASCYKVSANLNVTKLLFHTLEIEGGHVDSLRLNIVQEGKTFNFSSLFTSKASKTIMEDSLPYKKGKPLNFVLKNLRVTNGTVHYLNQEKRTLVRAVNFNAETPKIKKNSPHIRGSVDFDLVTGGHFDSKLFFNWKTLEYKADIEINALKIKRFNQYICDVLEFQEITGKVYNKLHVEGELKNPLNLSIHGTARLEDFKYVGPDGVALLEFDQLKVEADSLNIEKEHFILGVVRLSNPEMRFSLLKDGGTTFDQLFPETAQNDSIQGDSNSIASYRKPFPLLKVKKLIVEDGTLHFTDNTFNTPFRETIKHIEVTSKKYESNTSAIEGNTSMELSAGGKVGTSFKLNQKSLDYELEMDAGNVSIETFKPYITKFLALSSIEGRLTNKLLVQGNLREILSPTISGTAELSKFKSRDLKGKHLASWDKLYLNAALVDIKRHRFQFNKVQFNQPFVTASITQGSHSLNEILRVEESNQIAARRKVKHRTSSTQSVEAINYSVKMLEVKQGKLYINDYTSESVHQFHFHTINLKSQNLASDLPWMEPHIDFITNGGSTVNLDLRYNQQSHDFSIKSQIQDFPLSYASPVLKKFFNFKELEGRFTQDGFVEGNKDTIENVTLKGKYLIKDFLLRDTSGRRLAAWDLIDAEVKSLDFKRRVFHLSSLNMEHPLLHYEVTNKGSNIDGLLGIKASTAPSTYGSSTPTEGAKKARKKVILTMDSFNLSRGRFRYINRTWEETFTYNLDSIEMKLLDKPQAPNVRTLKVSMGLNRTGTLTSEIDFERGNFMEMNGTANIEGMNLRQLNPLAKHHIHYSVDNGILDYKGKIRIHNMRLKSKNHFKLKKIVIGDKVASTADNDLPIKLYIELMKNQKGDAKIHLPIHGDLDDPRFNLKNTIVTSFRQLIIKTVSSPYSIVASQLKTDLSKLKEIPFDYLERELVTSHQTESLEHIGKLLKRKKKLKVIFTQYTDLEEEIGLLAIIETNNKRTGIEKPIVPDSWTELRENPQEWKKFNQYVKKEIRSAPEIEQLSEEEINKMTLKEKCILLVGRKNLRKKMRALVKDRNDFIANYMVEHFKLPKDQFKVVSANMRNIPKDEKFPHFYISFY